LLANRNPVLTSSLKKDAEVTEEVQA
jgi:hypothetical protein